MQSQVIKQQVVSQQSLNVEFFENKVLKQQAVHVVSLRSPVGPAVNIPAVKTLVSTEVADVTTYHFEKMRPGLHNKQPQRQRYS